MTKLLRAGLVALLGIALAAPAALAGKVVISTPSKGHMKVYDDAGVFHPDSVIKSETKFDGVLFKSPTFLTVRTFKSVPAEKKADYEKVKSDKQTKRSFMKEWARELSHAENDRGVFILVCTESHSIEVLADHETDLYRHFTDTDANTAYDTLAKAFKSAEEAKTDDEKRTIRGNGLVSVTDFVISQLRHTSAPDATANANHSGGSGTTEHKPGMPWWGWALIVVGVLLFIWIIVAIIRASSGAVYGPGYGGYYYGGGGGGFWPCFMGGMFGTMAGMWMYNSFFGGHMYYDSAAAAAGTYPDGGYNPDAGDTGAGDFDNGAEAGGDWDGGGDTGGDGGGGGDWGSDTSGDTGGGGDWGNDGGGGDWGGDAGGGGDWGGGGGDFGGGGGDW